MYDLDAHTWDVHDESIECNLCDQTFEKDTDLLEHKKESHRVQLYRKLLYNTCVAKNLLYPNENWWSTRRQNTLKG